MNAQLLSLDSTYRAAGVSRYIYNLVRCLHDADPTSRYTALVGEHVQGWLGIGQQISRVPMNRPLARVLWEQTRLPFQLRSLRADLLHAPVNVAPLQSVCPTVVTVHDLSFIHYPDSFRVLQRLYQRTMMPISIRRAARVIAVSENTKMDLLRLCRADPARVQVVYNGVEGRFRPIAKPEVEEFRRQRGLPERMILFVGTLEPRKNVTTLLKAYALLRKTGRTEVPLVIAGGRGWLYGPTLALAEELDLGEHVFFPGYVSDTELPLWYNAAEIFVFPSLYEGFGLTPLEAMACGTPVIVSSASSLPEVVGDAGLIVESQNVEGLAEAIARLLDDPALRKELGAAGQRRAREFTWPKTAQKTVAVYRQALDEEGN